MAEQVAESTEEIVQSTEQAHLVETTAKKIKKAKMSEQELNNIIDWLKNEIATINSSAEDLKADKIRDAAKRLEEGGFRKHQIAAELARHRKDLGVGKGTIYGALDESYKSKPRVDGTKEGAKSRPPRVSPTLDKESPGSDNAASVINDTTSELEQTDSEISNSGEGVVPSEQLGTITPKEVVSAGSDLMSAINLMLQEAVVENDKVIIPKPTFDKIAVAMVRLQQPLQ